MARKKTAVSRWPKRDYRTSAAYKKMEASKMRVQASLRRTREKLKEKGTPIQGTLCTAGGGLIAGAVAVNKPSFFGISSPLVIGAVVSAVGIYSDESWAPSVACVGAGMLAAGASDYMKNALTYQENWNPYNQAIGFSVKANG